MISLIDDILYTIVTWLPKRLVYQCATEVLLHATGEDYPLSNIESIRAVTALKRYCDDFGVKL